MGSRARTQLCVYRDEKFIDGLLTIHIMTEFLIERVTLISVFSLNKRMFQQKVDKITSVKMGL